MNRTENKTEVYSEKLEGLKMKFKKDNLTNKKSVYIKYLHLIVGSNALDGIVYSDNWIEFENRDDCRSKVRKCFTAILLYQGNMILKQYKQRMKYVNNIKIQ
jgi:hypothetical protein